MSIFTNKLKYGQNICIHCLLVNYGSKFFAESRRILNEPCIFLRLSKPCDCLDEEGIIWGKVWISFQKKKKKKESSHLTVIIAKELVQQLVKVALKTVFCRCLIFSSLHLSLFNAPLETFCSPFFPLQWVSSCRGISQVIVFQSAFRSWNSYFPAFEAYAYVHAPAYPFSVKKWQSFAIMWETIRETLLHYPLHPLLLQNRTPFSINFQNENHPLLKSHTLRSFNSSVGETFS